MERTWKPGDVIWTAGEIDVKPLRIVSGIVTYVLGQEHQRGLGILGPGGTALPIPGMPGTNKALLGLMAVTEAKTEPTSATGIAAEDVTALIRGVERALTQDLSQRLAGALLEMTQLLGSDSVVTQQGNLAIALGVRRETLATVLSQWNNAEWIRTRYRRVTVKDRHALAAISEGRLP